MATRPLAHAQKQQETNRQDEKGGGEREIENYSVISPEAVTLTSSFGLLPALVGVASTARTTSMPSRTLPKTTWRPLSHGVSAVQMKN